MAKKTKKTPVRDAQTIAQDLLEVRARMAIDKPLNEVLTKEFKEALKREGVKNAGNYKLAKSESFKVSIEELALPFALQRNLVKIDTSKVRQVFRLDEQLRFKDPAEYGFEIITQERVMPIDSTEEEE